MAIQISPELEPPQTQTKVERRRSDGLFTRIRHRIKLAMSGDDEELLIVNSTTVRWHIYHKFHQLGILDPGEARLFRLQKRGNLNARPDQERPSDAVDYLVLDLSSRIERVEIYRRSMGQALEVYDMRAA